MDQKDKILVTEEGFFDLNAFKWDDNRFSAILVKHNAINSDQAMDISRLLREEISRMETHTVTMPEIEKIVEAKLQEYGLLGSSHVRLDRSFLVKNGLSLSDNAVRVLERRYLRTDGEGHVIETPEQMFKRVANHIAGPEKKYGGEERMARMADVFYKMMTELKFLPNSPTLMNAGRRLGQLAACFVLPVEDSMEGIFDALKNAALIHKSGGGTGFSFSRLRSKNSRVGTTGGIASGPVSFMKIFNTATEQVKQGGTRRGANMAILRVDHPDILEFISCKKNDKALNNFNISVAITDDFMDAVKKNTTYDLIDPRENIKTGELNAADVYYGLVRQAWENGDPGIVFLDRVNRDNPTPELGEIESTNPCGEQPLLPMEACNLGSINLAKFVTTTGEGLAVDYEGLRELVWNSVRFLDNTISVSKYPLPEIDRMVKGNRKIGLGVMGFADMLYQLNVPYNSDKAVEIAEDVMRFVQEESHNASRHLAEERGVFGNFDKSIFKGKEGCAYRNATTTTIAPTGTLSIIAGCSSGIEPLFALSFVRHVMDDDKLPEVNPYFEKVAKERGFYSRALMDTIARNGSIRDIDEIPQDVKDVFVTSHDISPEWHIRMQAAFQKYTDNAVSKTVNLPHDSTVSDVLKVYNLAYELGCKGVTIYRDGSKENQVLSFTDKAKEQEGFMTAVRDRPETLEGFTSKMVTGLGTLYVTVTEYEGRPFEVFATIGKSGRSTTAKTEAIGRLVSLALRSGVGVENVVEQLKGIGGEHPVFQNGGLVLSIPDAISRVLEKRYMKDKKANGGEKTLSGQKCPECGEPISFEEGCMTCHFCGFSKCG
ncbi:Ribonucleoside-diphosphate reductase [uncultured Desulfobacterium sp.]|uniref:Vitamin B12-dependent ribonucleotide reductase n=1 Tax=uncultured Desulfobacterium sp. TaxID=201089 RepID=A0A445MT81_9BACT|nr:Ribonucleoside-diphosphate reductase [uncultured Desulfobacterium sp.]